VDPAFSDAVVRCCRASFSDASEPTEDGHRVESVGYLADV